MASMYAAVVAAAVAAALLPAPAAAAAPGVWKRLTNSQVHAFYYLWYGNPAHDGAWKHWNHKVLPHWTDSVRAQYPEDVQFIPPHDTHSPYYPARGLYSSANASLILEHLKDMRTHGIGVVVVSWWGRPGLSSGDSQGVVTDDIIDDVFEAASTAGMSVALHLEPYPGRNITTIADDIAYLRDKYDHHQSWYRLPTRRMRLPAERQALIQKHEEERKAAVEAERAAKKAAREAAKAIKKLGAPGNATDTATGNATAAEAAAGNASALVTAEVGAAGAVATKGPANDDDDGDDKEEESNEGDATGNKEEEEEVDDGPWYSPRMWQSFEPQPVFYVYDSYHIPKEDWQRLLMAGGDLCLRGNRSTDGVFVGLWLEKGHGRELADSGFDGSYTYFATDGFSWGSTQSHWKKMATFARERDMMFVPCVSPGYDDSKIRPWNRANRRDREEGDYYQRAWKAALASKTIYVGVTTYNEWGEGTQIEAALPRAINVTGLAPRSLALAPEVRSKLKVSDAYSNYLPQDPDFYMMETLRFSAKLADQVGFTEVGKDLRKMEEWHDKQKRHAMMEGVHYIHSLPDDERREAPVPKREKKQRQRPGQPPHPAQAQQPQGEMRHAMSLDAAGNAQAA